MNFRSVSVLIAVLAMSCMAHATPYNLNGTWVEVDYWAGSGPSETIVVIDWNDTNGPYITESHAWGYRWSGTKYVSDAVTAICDAGALIVTTSYGGAFVDDAFYHDASIDTDDHTSAGYSGWWWLGSSADGGQTWDGNAGTITSEVLVHNQIEGCNMDSGAWTSATLTIPVPEPAAALLLALGGLLSLRGLRQ